MLVVVIYGMLTQFRNWLGMSHLKQNMVDLEVEGFKEGRMTACSERGLIYHSPANLRGHGVDAT